MFYTSPGRPSLSYVIVYIVALVIGYRLTYHIHISNLLMLSSLFFEEASGACKGSPVELRRKNNLISKWLSVAGPNTSRGEARQTPGN